MIDIGPEGVRLNRRFGRPAVLAWSEIGTIARPSRFIRIRSALWPVIPTRFAALTLSALQCHLLIVRDRPLYFAPADGLALETAVSRWRAAPSAGAVISGWRRTWGSFIRSISPLLIAACFAPLYATVAFAIKYATEPAGASDSGILLRAFLLKPSAAEAGNSMILDVCRNNPYMDSSRKARETPLVVGQRGNRLQSYIRHLE